jgi:hypothetical protein
MLVTSIYVSSVSVVSYIYCKRFIWMLHMFAMFFKYFSGFFLQVFQTGFICLLLYVATVVSGCFKSRLSVAHEIHVGSGWRRGRCLRQHRPAARALARKPDALGACSHI